MINKVILKGNIGKNPHIALDQRGREIASFSLATNTKWKDGSGEWHQHVDWHQIVIFRDSTVRWIKDVLKKGDTVYVEGKLTYQEYIDKNNVSHKKPSIIISGSEGRVEYIRSKNPPPVDQKSEPESPLKILAHKCLANLNTEKKDRK